MGYRILNQGGGKDGNLMGLGNQHDGIYWEEGKL